MENLFVGSKLILGIGITKVSYPLCLLVYETSVLIVYSKILNKSNFNLDFYLAKIKNFRCKN